MARGDLIAFNEALAFMLDGGWESTDDIKCAVCDNTVTPSQTTASPALGDFTEVGTAGSNPGITAGDMLVAYAALRSDAATQSAIGVTATSATIAAFTESPTADLVTTSGGDMAMSGGYAACTSGTATAAPVYASTLAAAHTGSAYIMRLREAADTFIRASTLPMMGV